MKLKPTPLPEYLCSMPTFKAIDQVYITCKIRVLPLQREVPEEQGHTASERLWFLQTKQPHCSPVSSVLTVAKSWDQQCGAGLSGKASQALHQCTRRERQKEFTPGRKIIYGITRVKRRFFSRSWYLYYSNLVFGHMEYPLPLKY